MKVFSMEKALESVTKGSKDENVRQMAYFVLGIAKQMYDGMPEEKAREIMKGMPDEIFEEREEK